MKKLKKELKELKEELKEVENQIDNFELDPDDYEENYNDFLDDSDTINILGLEYATSYVLKKIDPIVYRCGLLDYVDGIDFNNIPEYKELLDKKDDLEYDIDNLEEELKEI